MQGAIQYIYKLSNEVIQQIWNESLKIQDGRIENPRWRLSEEYHTLFKHFQKNWLHSLKCIHRSYLHFVDKNLKYISKTFGLG